MQFSYKPFVIVISSPSGVGKSTICQKLITKDNEIKLSISATTRQQKKNEVHGKDYFFISIEEYNKLVMEDKFLEHAYIFGNYYGSLKKQINENFSLGKNILFDIDIQGKIQLEKEHDSNNIISIFLLPPSLKELKNRILKRNRDSNNVISERLSNLKQEISYYKNYQYILINEDLNQTVNKIHSIIEANKIKRQIGSNISKFVNGFITNIQLENDSI